MFEVFDGWFGYVWWVVLEVGGGFVDGVEVVVVVVEEEYVVGVECCFVVGVCYLFVGVVDGDDVDVCFGFYVDVIEVLVCVW